MCRHFYKNFTKYYRLALEIHFLEPQFQNFLREAPGPPIKGGPPPPRCPDKTTARLFIGIVRRPLKVIFPLLQIFGRTLATERDLWAP